MSHVQPAVSRTNWDAYFDSRQLQTKRIVSFCFGLLFCLFFWVHVSVLKRNSEKSRKSSMTNIWLAHWLIGDNIVKVNQPVASLFAFYHLYNMLVWDSSPLRQTPLIQIRQTFFQIKFKPKFEIVHHESTGSCFFT